MHRVLVRPEFRCFVNTCLFKESARASCSILNFYSKRCKQFEAGSSFSTGATSGSKPGRKQGIVAGFIAVAGLGGYCYFQNKQNKEQKAAAKLEVPQVAAASISGAVQPAVAPRPGEGALPVYSLQQVRDHSGTDGKGVWVTSGPYVYDITDYVPQHPGGSKIMLAAGKSVDPFWKLYAVHKEDFVQTVLKEMKIGVLSAEDYKAMQAVSSKNDAFVNDPDRPPVFKVNSETPFNAEPMAELAAETLITPNETFFIRNHLPVPKVDGRNHSLKVDVGKGIFSFSVNELKMKFKEKTVGATLMCAGNRRSEMSSYKDVHGLSWTTNAIGNALWTGVPLRDVLLAAGLTDDDATDSSLHVQFEGLDKGPEGAAYGASVSLRTAMDPNRELLLAYKMNGEDIPLDHGYPLRIIIPGHVGARHVKWLSSISVAAEESLSFWQRNDYKVFSPSTTRETADFSKAAAIQEAPVLSAICEPRGGDSLEAADETVTVRGYAWSGGGRGIIRVDVSPDGGATWLPTELEQSEQHPQAMWSWTLWEASVPIPAQQGSQMELICKATDIAHNTQPESVAGIWNFRGLLNNSWHRVKVNVV